jgi:nicotinate-nucleotide adenylyltransferase
LPVVVGRAGGPPVDLAPLARLLPPERVEQIRAHQVVMPEIGISATEIRRRVAADLSIRYQVPRAVEKYIETSGLYRGQGIGDRKGVW